MGGVRSAGGDERGLQQGLRGFAPECVTRALSEEPGPRGLAMGAAASPLLIKFLDCEDRLSVQVHPDDAYAGANEGGSRKDRDAVCGGGGTGRSSACGLKPGIDRPALRAPLPRTRAETLAEVPVSPGDCFFIPAGTVHALGGGLIICEIQQNSDVTYRFYD